MTIVKSDEFKWEKNSVNSLSRLVLTFHVASWRCAFFKLLTILLPAGSPLEVLAYKLSESKSPRRLFFCSKLSAHCCCFRE